MLSLGHCRRNVASEKQESIATVSMKKKTMKSTSDTYVQCLKSLKVLDIKCTYVSKAQVKAKIHICMYTNSHLYEYTVYCVSTEYQPGHFRSDIIFSEYQNQFFFLIK